MSAIQASSAGVKDMADGSLRITFEFDPRYAKEAYALFGARGTSCAIAALTQESTIKAAQVEAQEPKTKAGELCIMACNFCKDPLFQQWLCVTDEHTAKLRILALCQCTSRKEIDSDLYFSNLFHAHVRAPFMQWKWQAEQ
jgi:hypothetical protein